MKMVVMASFIVVAKVMMMIKRDHLFLCDEGNSRLEEGERLLLGAGYTVRFLRIFYLETIGRRRRNGIEVTIRRNGTCKNE